MVSRWILAYPGENSDLTGTLRQGCLKHLNALWVSFRKTRYFEMNNRENIGKPLRVFKLEKLKIGHFFLLRVPGFSKFIEFYAPGSGFFHFFCKIGPGFVGLNPEQIFGTGLDPDGSCFLRFKPGPGQ